MIQATETRFRLRQDDEIVGFKKTVESSEFYSKDGFWWSGKIMEYAQIDEQFPLLDKNRKPLFSQDIIHVKRLPNLYFILHFDHALNIFLLIDFETQGIFTSDAVLFLQQEKSFEWKSYSFIN